MKAMVRMIGVVTNPRAGKNVKNPARIQRLTPILGSNGFLREARTSKGIMDIAVKWGLKPELFTGAVRKCVLLRLL